MRVKPVIITTVSKCGPFLTVVLATIVVSLLLNERQSISVVGVVPSGFPELSMNALSDSLGQRGKSLLPYAAFIALIAYVKSVAIAKAQSKSRYGGYDYNTGYFCAGRCVDY